jgi:hypothetical protein
LKLTSPCKIDLVILFDKETLPEGTTKSYLLKIRKCKGPLSMRKNETETATTMGDDNNRFLPAPEYRINTQ